MKMQPRMIFVCCLTIIFAMGLTGTADAVTYDLKTDWSNINNPNGPWQYNQGTDKLPLQTDYDSSHGFYTGLSAWAKASYPAVGHVPVWLQAPQDGFWGGDFQTGDIMMHPTHGPSSLGTGEGNVTWTSSLTGVALISGNTWYGEQFSGRSVDWILSFNGVALDQGTVLYGDSYDRTNPDKFGTFTKNVKPDDVLTFTAVLTPGTIPWFIGVNLTVEVTPISPVPVPPPVWLFGTGLAGLTLLRFRK